MGCHSDQRQQIELADCVVGSSCVQARRRMCASGFGGKREVGSGCTSAAHLSVEWQGSEGRRGWVPCLPQDSSFRGSCMGFPSMHHPSPCPRRVSASLSPVETQDRNLTGCSLSLLTPPFGPREVSSLRGDSSSRQGCRVPPLRAVDWEVAGLRLDTRSPPQT